MYIVVYILCANRVVWKQDSTWDVPSALSVALIRSFAVASIASCCKHIKKCTHSRSTALQVQISPQRPVAAPGGSLMEQVLYPSPLPEGLADVDTQLLAHLLQQVGLSELLQRAQGDWMLSQDWQGACHATYYSSDQPTKNIDCCSC